MNKYIDILGHKISSYHLFIFIGILAFIISCFIRRKKFDFSIKKIIFIIIIFISSALIGGRLYAIISNINKVKEQGISSITGFAIFGGITFATLAIFIYTKISKDTKYQIFDLITPGSALILALSKFGCFMNGCCAGIETKFGWNFPVEPNVSRIPIQLIESSITLIIFFVLLIIEKKNKGKSWLFMYFLGMYTFFRFFCEFLRDSYDIEKILTTAQIICIAYLTLFGILLIRREKIINKKDGLKE